jgi:hypothetical protein
MLGGRLHLKGGPVNQFPEIASAAMHLNVAGNVV